MEIELRNNLHDIKEEPLLIHSGMYFYKTSVKDVLALLQGQHQILQRLYLLRQVDQEKLYLEKIAAHVLDQLLTNAYFTIVKNKNEYKVVPLKDACYHVIKINIAKQNCYVFKHLGAFKDEAVAFNFTKNQH